MRILLIFFCSIIGFTSQSQITGNLKLHANQELVLEGFNNLKSEILSTTTVDSLGNFTLIYPNDYRGMVSLKTSDFSSLLFALTESSLKFKGNHLKEKENILFLNSKENKTFFHFFKEYRKRLNVTSAWYYLKTKYEKEYFFQKEKIVLNNIKKEISRLEKKDIDFLKKIESNSYMSWYLPLKKMVSDMQIILRHNPQQISITINKFRDINFNNSKFKTSGLLKDLIDGHYDLIEKSGQHLDSIYTQVNKSTSYLLTNLSDNENLLNIVSNYLFDYLEKRSLQKNAEYLAVQLLSLNGCNLEEKLTNKLESYRKLKIGKIAPDIIFSNNTKLSDIISTKLLVFGASWCPKCKEDVLKLSNYYNSWKQKGVEVIYVSIDTNKADFENFYSNFSWKTECDFKGWETLAVKDYHVFATPTYFLLDKDLKIILRPNSIEQTNRWIHLNIIN